MEEVVTKALEELPIEGQKELSKPISEEEFRKRIHEVALANQRLIVEDFNRGILHLRDYSGVKKFKSIRKAIKRGHVSIFGDVYPKRPFSNKKRGPGSLTYRKKKIYEQLVSRSKKVTKRGLQ